MKKNSLMKSLGNKPINGKDPIIEMDWSTLLNSSFNREHKKFVSAHNSGEARRRCIPKSRKSIVKVKEKEEC